MKILCEVIQDLIPLYADEVCSEKSRELVDEHCKKCTECSRMLEAATIPLPDAGIKNIPQQPLKKTKRHYLRIAVITAIICALLSYPLLKAGQLTVNEVMNNPTDSWSYCIAENKIDRFMNCLENGKGQKALKIAEFERFDGGVCSDADSDRMSEDIGRVLNDFFMEYPITSYDVSSPYSYAIGEARIDVTVRLDQNTTIVPIAASFVFRLKADKKLYLYEMVIYDASEADYEELQKNYPLTESIFKKFPQTLFPGQMFTENFDNAVGNSDYSDISNIVRTHEYLKYRAYPFEISLTEDDARVRELCKINDNKLAEYCEEFSRDMRVLFTENYKYQSISGSSPVYDLNVIMSKGTVFEYASGFSQDITINMADMNGENFSVSFTALVMEYAEAPFSDITYSDNTPKEFREEFERLLG